ncbi:acyltransferase family protein [Scandinavium manionii]|uniref:acyltransferase family protein n=1 Tax=Scandinavium manionii TaxID=2926520 RepID=UPI0021660034|nr:acyltransferase [Scandinavium manionii]
MDGLRGLAVLLVVFFHAGWLSGGFVGVDIFCVISGYYMSKTALMNTPFTPWKFVARRIQRLLPALLCMVTVVSLATLWWVLPMDRQDIAYNGWTALLYVSNFWASHHVGYFAGQSLAYPFLHTWSLSVEMQFYLLILLLGITRQGWGALCCIAVGSLVAGQFNGGMGYYGFIERLWQFAIGGIIAWLPARRLLAPWLSSLIYCLATTSIVACSILFQGNDATPSLWALIPCLSAAILLLIPDAPANNLLATLSPAGRISYSLYLWHWPVIVWATYFFERQITGLSMALCIAAAIGISIISYLFIERRISVLLLLAINAVAAALLLIISHLSLYI